MQTADSYVEKLTIITKIKVRANKTRRTKWDGAKRNKKMISLNWREL